MGIHVIYLLLSSSSYLLYTNMYPCIYMFTDVLMCFNVNIAYV